MAERLIIESVVSEYANSQSLSSEKIEFLSREFLRLVEEGDYTKDLGSPPEWVQNALGSWEYKNCTWGHCVCDVLAALGVAPEHDPLEAPYEFLGAESVWSEDEIRDMLQGEINDWDTLTGTERLKRFTNAIRRLRRP
jgi:hypothetical protein